MTGVAVVFLGLALGLTEVHRGNATARESRIVETAFYSHAVEGPMRMSVYLPAGYAKSHKRYPVVYFLHGLPASTSSYRSIDFLRTALDAAGRPAILVSAQGARDNDTDPEYHDWGPGRNWETAAGKELPRFVDAHFRTIPNRRGRALVGLSAGGYGAVLVGLHHLGTFSVVESWSGYFHPTDPTGTKTLDVGSAAEAADASAHTFVGRLRAAFRDQPTFLAFYVGRGDDRFRTENVELDRELAQARVPHVFRLYSGAHEQAVWSAHARPWLALALAHLAPSR